MSTTIKLTAFGKTDRGRQRKNNEDSFIVDPERLLFALADGMGGAAGGEVASTTFTASISHHFNISREERSARMLPPVIEDCFATANNQILTRGRANPILAGMGCTGELLTFTGSQYFIGHVGDSRTYRCRNNVLQQLTRDHTLEEDPANLQPAGKPFMSSRMLANILSRAVGTNSQVDVDILCGDIEPRDLFLMCSDGLYNMVDEDDITAVLVYDAPLELKAEMLVNMANEAGGRDNITVLLVLLEELPPAIGGA